MLDSRPRDAADRPASPSAYPTSGPTPRVAGTAEDALDYDACESRRDPALSGVFPMKWINCALEKELGCADFERSPPTWTGRLVSRNRSYLGFVPFSLRRPSALDRLRSLQVPNYRDAPGHIRR
jgi:hypothetical protein